MIEGKWDEDTLKGVFLYRGKVPADLARCKLVCKKWRDILTKDDFMGRCLCAQIWPSLCTSQSRDMTPRFTHIYRTFSNYLNFRKVIRQFIPKSSIIDYKFYLDIWNGDDGSLILSKVIKASSLSRDRGYSIPSPGFSGPFRSDYRLFAPLEPRLTIPRPKSVNVSLLVGREHDETACIIHKSATHAVLPQASFAVAFNDLDFCLSTMVFVPHVRAWLCMYFLDDNVADDTVDVFGIELGFSDVLVEENIRPPANKKYLTHDYWYPLQKRILRALDEDKFLCLLDSLDWKRYNQKISDRESAGPAADIGEFERASCEEVVNLVFPFLEGNDLAKCLLVSKQWRDIGEDEYFWKCLCAKGWPSLYKELLQPKLQNIKTYHQMFGKHWLKPPRFRPALDFPPPVLDISDVELYLDISVGELLVYSKAINGADLLAGGIDASAPDICDAIKIHLESSEFKLVFPIEPRLSILLKHHICINLLARRRDVNKVASLFGPASILDYHYPTARGRFFNIECNDTCPNYPFAPDSKVCFSLLIINMSEGRDDSTRPKEVCIFGVELDFFEIGHVFDSKEQLLWLLHMLEWK